MMTLPYKLWNEETIIAFERFMSASKEEKVMDNHRVQITYTNWQGITNNYTIIPISITYKEIVFFPGKTRWYLTALDVDREVERDFAIEDIRDWKGVVE